MTDHTAHRLSAPLGLTANLTIGALVHLLAALVYATLSMLRLEGCSRAAALAAGWALAVLIDLLLGGVLLVAALRGADGRRWVVLAGWGLSLAPFVAATGATMNYFQGLTDGCGP